MSDDDNGEPVFSVVALRYRSNGAAARAYERVLRSFCVWEDSGDSLYRCVVAGAPTLVVVSWAPTDEHLAAVASLPWGDGEPVVLPMIVRQELAQRSLEARPKSPSTIRRIFRDATGRVIGEHEMPAGEAGAGA
jgi:hypothetical protein